MLRINQRRHSFLLLVCLLLTTPIIAQDDVDPTDLPLLPSRFHLGTTFYGSGTVPEQPALADQVAYAAQSGMTAFTFYVDWADLEPEPGIYTLHDLEASLRWLHDMDIYPLLNITLIDIDRLSLPFDMTLTDSQLPDRLHQLLDQVLPLLLDNGGFLLLLGNEVDGYFNDVAPADLDAYTQLIAGARDYIQALEARLAVGVALTGTETYAQGRVFQALRPVTDVIPFNYYGLSAQADDWLTMLDEDALRSAIDRYAEIYDGGTMIIQELGCPSANSNESSPEIQAQCFEALFDALRAYPNVRYVTVFTLYDFDEPTCDLVIDYFGLTPNNIGERNFDRWRGYACTLGLLNSDYSPKPAWAVFIDALRAN